MTSLMLLIKFIPIDKIDNVKVKKLKVVLI